MSRMRNLLIAWIALVLGAGLATVSEAESTADLRALFDRDVAALNAHQPEAFVASAHDGIVIFGILSPFPVDGKKEFREVMRQYLEDYVEVVFIPTQPEFSAAHGSGIAWGHYTLVTRMEDGPREYAFGRYSMAYTNTDGTWALTAMHLSPLQPSYYSGY